MEMSKFQQILDLAMKRGMKLFSELQAFLQGHGLDANKDEHFEAIIQALKVVA